MDIYRQQSLPVIYTHLPFIRYVSNAVLADLPEDKYWLEQLKMVASGKRCISVLERPHELIMKGSFPDDILQRDGTTGDLITWQYYYWKLWDVESFINQDKPSEAIPLEQTGIGPSNLETLASDTSCVPLLKKCQAMFDYGDYKGYCLTKDAEGKLIEYENRMIAALQLHRMKGNPLKPRSSMRTKTSPSVTPRLRDRILRRDIYRCIFCGKKGPDTVIEVNHIIPRSIISKLHLEERLVKSEENLCTTCFECNRGKTDFLSKEDIDFYINSFSTQTHPNHGIVKYLQAVRSLQGR
jgi:5-methylcytosine-specific restriction endonuclease McrA